MELKPYALPDSVNKPSSLKAVGEGREAPQVGEDVRPADFPEQFVPRDFSGDGPEGVHGKHGTLHADFRRPREVQHDPRRTGEGDFEGVKK